MQCLAPDWMDMNFPSCDCLFPWWVSAQEFVQPSLLLSGSPDLLPHAARDFPQLPDFGPPHLWYLPSLTRVVRTQQQPLCSAGCPTCAPMSRTPDAQPEHRWATTDPGHFHFRASETHLFKVPLFFLSHWSCIIKSQDSWLGTILFNRNNSYTL